MNKKCLRCGKQFVHAKKHYRYCEVCFPDVAPLGYTSSRQRPGAAARIHGGVSRTTDGRRSVVFRGDATTLTILKGLEELLSDLYQRPTRISALLHDAGMGRSEIKNLRERIRLGNFVMRFIPALWEWLKSTVGAKASEVVVSFYGLYGDGRRRIPNIARDLDITVDHAGALRGWALNQIRDPKNWSLLEQMAVSTARSILEGDLGSE